MTDRLRATFERWLTSDGQYPGAAKRSGDGYALMQVNLMWTAVKAVFAAMKENK